jgi:hypothetical protein
LEIKKEGFYKTYWPESGGYYTIGQFETKWVNLSLDPFPPKNSFVKGYVKDFITKEPIENVTVNLEWEDGEGYSEYNSTQTNPSGYYCFNTAEGYIYLDFIKVGYYDQYKYFNIEGNDTIWLNVSLNSSGWDYLVCGFINSADTSLPIENATVKIYWKKLKGWYTENITYTNKSGFYRLFLTRGTIRDISINAEGFFPKFKYVYYNLSDKFKIWYNFSLIPRPPETAKVYGYIKDSDTNQPIENATVYINWYGNKTSDLHYDNKTYSNSFGFYCFNIAPGFIGLSSKADGYFHGSDYIVYELEKDEILWHNISLDKIPIENAVICGYIKDVKTNKPMWEVEIYSYWTDFNYKNHCRNNTYSNSSGFYIINVPSGKVYIEASMHNYLNEYSKLIDVQNNQIIWINLSMYKKPPRNSRLCGYIKDFKTDEPIYNVSIGINWIGCEFHHQSFSDIFTDEEGFYSVKVPAGELHLKAVEYNYDRKESKRIDIIENETTWYNTSLNEYKIDVEINKPLPAVYIKNDLKFPFLKPLIIGDIEIEIFVWGIRDNFDRLELFIDDELKLLITNESFYGGFYSYLWKKDKLKIFGHQHTIRAKLYDKDGYCDIEEIEVWKFL